MNVLSLGSTKESIATRRLRDSRYSELNIAASAHFLLPALRREGKKSVAELEEKPSARQKSRRCLPDRGKLITTALFLSPSSPRVLGVKQRKDAVGAGISSTKLQIVDCGILIKLMELSGP